MTAQITAGTTAGLPTAPAHRGEYHTEHRDRQERQEQAVRPLAGRDREDRRKAALAGDDRRDD